MLAIAAVILIVTMDRWVEVFSALLACGILGGIITIAGGHAVNNPRVRVARLDAVIMTLLIAASAVVSFTFTKRKLRLPDRIALFVFVFCFFWGAAVPRLGLLALGIGTALLVAAWDYDRIMLLAADLWCRPLALQARREGHEPVGSPP
jgi:chromate transport protein ChrA